MWVFVSSWSQRFPSENFRENKMIRHSLLVVLGTCFVVAILLLAQQYRSSRIRLDILNRASLIQPRESALSLLLQSEVDTSCIRCFGFDVRSFNAILAPFAADYTSYTLHQDTNRLKRLSFPLRSNRKVSASLCLGLVLSFYRSGPCFIFLSKPS